MPKASIVIPCYNAARFIEQTVQSAQRQTVDDVEIICVDDGSTDSTLDELHRMAKEDVRIRVIEQSNGGEGPARDAGLSAATGDWLYFLDADDLMGPTLLEEAIAQGEREMADIVIFRTTMLDDKTGEQSICDWSFKRDWLEGDTFCPREHPQHVFDSFQNWVHNKLFRGSFVRKHNLHMQHVHRTADLLFTCRALAEAERITLLDRPLYQYRINNAQSAMSTSNRYPLDFYYAFIALKDSLIEQGTWELYHDSFVNWAFEGVAVNLRLSRNYEAYCAIEEALVREGLEKLGITSLSRDAVYMPYYYDQLQPLIEESSDSVSAKKTLFRIASSYRIEQANTATAASHERMRCANLEEQLTQTNAQLRDAQEALDDKDSRIDELQQQLNEVQHAFQCVTGSLSFKLGRAVTAIPRGLTYVVRGIGMRRHT